MKTALIAALIALVVSYAHTSWLASPAATSYTPPDALSSYNRVMAARTLRCGYFTWPPYFSTDPVSGQHSGIYYDIINKLGQTLGLKVEWTMEYTLGQQVEALRAGKVDALCADGPWTRSAMPHLDYTTPYMFIPGYVFTLKGNPKFADPTDLARLNQPDVTFTALDGDGSAEYLDEYFPKAKRLTLPSTADSSLIVQNVLTGKADAMFNDTTTIAAQKPEDRARIQTMGSGKALATYPFLMSVSKGEIGLQNLLNQGLAVMQDGGMLEKIIRQHDPDGSLIGLPAPRYH